MLVKFLFKRNDYRIIKKKNEYSIRYSITSGRKLTFKTYSYSRNSALEKTKKYTAFWMEDLRKNRISIDGKIKKEKVLRIHNNNNKIHL